MCSMQTLNRQQVDEQWDKFWNEMSREWFKLEVLQDYTAEDDGPSLKAWLKGDKEKSIKLLKTDDDPDFTRDCRDKISQGVKLIRLHVIEEPLTKYLEWEIEYYKRISIPLRGEQVYIIHKSDLSDLRLPAGDLMIFDNRRAILNNYDQNGLMIEETFYDESDDISSCLELRNKLIRRAEKL
jgi:hypothetical protein